jgi:phosphatidylinositol alpha-1,6-mannosyltransferase
MRALVLTPDFPPASGGIQLLMHRLLTNLEGVRPRVVTLTEDDDTERFDTTHSLDVVRIARKSARRNRLAVAMLNAAGAAQGLRLRPEVVISGHVVTAPAARLLRKAGRGKVVQYLHADEFRNRPGLVRLAIERSDAVVAVSRHTRDMALSAGCEASRLHVVPPGVDLPAASSEARAERPTVLTVARLAERYKGHDVMIRALRAVRERVPEVQWTVLGDGPLRPWLESRVRAERLSGAVRFLGHVSDAERDRWFARAHVFAMPSRLPDQRTGGEGFGIVYLEAAAHALPVVGSTEGGAPDAVVDRETGVLVDPSDPAAVAEAIGGLLLDPERAAALGRAGAERARGFTWRRHAEAVEEIIGGITAG